jgi:predicted hydrocarbon binding protein
MRTKRKYAFSWSLLGDAQQGRPHLGRTLSLDVYRPMHFTFRDVLEQHLGAEQTDQIFREAGRLAGREFYRHRLAPADSFDSFIRGLQSALREMGMGILRVEQADLEHGSFIFTVSEDLDCSGLPELDYEICTYDEGFLAGLLEEFTGKPFRVRGEECWCTGGRTCRFSAKPTATPR